MASEAGSESPSGSSRFKVVSPPSALASSSPLGSAKMNHVANNSAPSASNTPYHIQQNGDEHQLTELSEDKGSNMQPREAVVRSVPSIELPDEGMYRYLVF